MEEGPETGLSKGTIISGIGHVGLILWVVVGDFLFPHTEPEVIEVTNVSMMTEAEFQAMQSSAPSPSETPSPEQPQAEPVQPEPQPEPQPQPDPQPTIEPPPQLEPTVEPDPAPQPDPVPEPDPVPQPDPQPQDVVVAPEEQPMPSMTASLRPKPKPADRVAPNPVDVPEDLPTADAPTEATSDTPTQTPEVVQEPQPQTAPEESGDVLRTEATEDQAEPLGMTASIRPKSRPARTETPAATETPTERPTETPTETPTESATNASDVDAALNDLDPTPEAPQETTSSGGSDAIVPTGPPLSGGEIGDVRSAIGGKWNLGTVSTDTMRTTIVVRVTFDQTGKPTDIKMLESDGPTAEATNTAFSAAKSAIVRAYREGGIPLPPDKYETWKVLDLVFDPNGMRFR